MLMDQWKQRRKGGLASDDLFQSALLVPDKAKNVDAEVLIHYSTATICQILSTFFDRRSLHY